MTTGPCRSTCPTGPAAAGATPAPARTRAAARRTTVRAALSVLGAGVLVATLPGTASAVTPRKPATLPAAVEALQPYVGQVGCDPVAKPGAAAFQALLMSTYTDTESYGIVRDCGIGGQSEHKEGRAFDWKVSASNPKHVAEVTELTDWLLATRDGEQAAMLRRFGIMYMIWNRHIWKAYQPEKGWQPYTGASAHTDHVHFSFGWNGARKATSWWTGKVAPVDYGPYVHTPVPPAPPVPPGPVVPAVTPAVSPANLKTLGTYGGTTLRVGSTGAAVRVVQTALRTYVDGALVVDGEFGNVTRSRVELLQSALKLPVTGVFGPAEWRATFPRPTNPFGSFETISSTAVTGWAADADTTSPIRVRVLVDRVAVTTAAAATARPELATSYPGIGTAHGYRVPVQLSPGTHSVCVIGINTGAGVDTSTGCATIKVLPPSSLAAAASRTSVVDVFSRSDEGAVMLRTVSGGHVQAARDLGGRTRGVPAVVERTASTQEIFVRGEDDGLYTKTLRADGTYSAWGASGTTITSRPAAATRDGRVDVVARSARGTLIHRSSTSAGTWSAWESLGGTLLPEAAPALAWTRSGRLDAFAVGTDNQVVRRSMSAKGTWGSWQRLGGLTSSDLSATASSQDGVTVARRRASGRTYVATVGSTSVGPWTRVSTGLASAPAIVAAPGSSTTQLFGVGADGKLSVRTRTGTQAWSDWKLLG